MGPDDRRRTDDRRLEQITDAFSEVSSGVSTLSKTVRENTRERRRNRIWIGWLIVAASIFSILEVVNLVEAHRVRTAVEAITCADAKDTRGILQPVLDETELSVDLPPLPEACR